MVRACVQTNFFFFNDTATTEIYTLSLHDALPISPQLISKSLLAASALTAFEERQMLATASRLRDRKSTRLNSSHSQISYAVFCLKKKKQAAHHHSPRNAMPQLPNQHRHKPRSAIH